MTQDQNNVRSVGAIEGDKYSYALSPIMRSAFDIMELTLSDIKIHPVSPEYRNIHGLLGIDIYIRYYTSENSKEIFGVDTFISFEEAELIITNGEQPAVSFIMRNMAPILKSIIRNNKVNKLLDANN